jgi:hypothetical protein
MKSSTFLMFLVSSMMIIALASMLVRPATAEDPIIVGKWDRLDGADVYTIYANHVTQTVLGEQTYHGTWEYDGSSGYKYIFHWEHSPPGREPFIDYVTVAADGQSYSGYNNYGDQFNCVRLSSETDFVPAADSGGFPIVYVAVGGGIAAIAAVGAAVYYFFVAGGSAPAAGPATAGTLGSETTGVATGSLGAQTGVSASSAAAGGLLIDPDVFGNVIANLLSDTITDIVSWLGYDCSGLAGFDMFGSSIFASPAGLENSTGISTADKLQQMGELKTEIEQMQNTLQNLSSNFPKPAQGEKPSQAEGIQPAQDTHAAQGTPPPEHEAPLTEQETMLLELWNTMHDEYEQCYSISGLQSRIEAQQASKPPSPFSQGSSSYPFNQNPQGTPPPPPEANPAASSQPDGGTSK